MKIKRKMRIHREPLTLEAVMQKDPGTVFEWYDLNNDDALFMVVRDAGGNNLMLSLAHPTIVSSGWVQLHGHRPVRIINVALVEEGA